MKRLALAFILLLIPLILISEGMETGRYGLAKAGFLILLFFIVLGVFFGEDKLRGKK
jgi:hypothetical protein